MIDSLARTPRAGTRVRRCGDARNQDSGVTTATGECRLGHRRTPTGAPRASRSGSRAPSHGARGPPPGWRRQAARRRRAVPCRPSPTSSTGALNITVHRASEQGGAPNPCLSELRSVLDVAVTPQCSSSSSGRTTTTTTITVHQASGRGGAPIPCLLVPCSVLDVAVIPQCSSSSSPSEGYSGCYLRLFSTS